MDIRDMAYFEAIARLESLTRAAAEVGRTKPALSKCIRRLEDRVEGALFERRGRRLVLTAAGQTLLSHAVRMRAAMADALRDVAEMAGGNKGHVRLGLGTSIVETLLPIIADWHRAEAGRTTLKLQIGLNDSLRRELVDDHLDGIVTTVQARDESNLARENWGEDDVVVVGRKGHPLDRRRAATISELSAFQWVLASRFVASRDWLDNVFIARGFDPPSVQVEIGSAQLVAAFIDGTDLLGFVPRRILRSDHARKTLVEITSADIKMHRSLGFITRKAGYVPPALMRLNRRLKTAIEAEGEGRT